jgi:hypothetical protein
MARYGDDTNRDRWRDDDRERSSWHSGDQGNREREDERGFFERAGEEVRSWFSDGRLTAAPDGSRIAGAPANGPAARPGTAIRDAAECCGAPAETGAAPLIAAAQCPAATVKAATAEMGRDLEESQQLRGMSQGGRSGGSFGREHERDFRSIPQRRRVALDEQSRPLQDGPAKAGRAPAAATASGAAAVTRRAGARRTAARAAAGTATKIAIATGRRSRSCYGSAMGGTMGGFGNQTSGSSQDDHYRSWRDRPDVGTRPRL